MTRTEYTDKLRGAGFRVHPLWQGKTEDPEGPRFDLTCYAIHDCHGSWLTNIVVRQAGAALFIFFEATSVRADDDIAYLRRLAGPEVTA